MLKGSHQRLTFQGIFMGSHRKGERRFLPSIFLLASITSFAIVLPVIHAKSALSISSEQSVSWNDVRDRLFNRRDEDPPLISRAPFCTIAPQLRKDKITEVWSDRPMFVLYVLRGSSIGKLEISPHDSKTVLWTRSVTLADRSTSGIAYAGEALQPGKIYDWVISDRRNNRLFSVPFQVMEAQKRDRIKAQLLNLEKKLQAKGATPEQVAEARANYFAEQQLWADVLQEIYSVRNPSEELKAILKEIHPQICLPQ